MGAYFIFVLVLAYSSILEYRFGENFGQVFYDYSENLRHGVNGESVFNTSKDTIPTDRGAYFPIGDYRVKLPPNTQSQNFLFPSSFTIALWTFVKDYAFTIFYKVSDTGCIIVKRYSIDNLVSVKIKTQDFDTSEIFSTSSAYANGNFYVDAWVLMMLTIETFVKININTNTIITNTLPQPYIDTGTSEMFLSYPISSTGIVGYIWNIIIIQGIADINTFIYASSTSNCLVNGCTTCNPGIVYNGQIGCLSKETDYRKDSLGNTCGNCIGSCVNNICLDCLCSIYTCELYNGLAYCKCPVGSTPTEKECTCPDKLYFTGISCEACNLECSSCLSLDSCEECIADNAYPYGTGCKCFDGFYSYGLLTQNDSCVKCDSKCIECDNFGNCLGCYDKNANATDKCMCNEGFYMDGICKVCYAECKKCSSFGICDECVSAYSVPIDFGCQCIDDYGAEGMLTNIESCVKCHEDCYTCTNSLQCLICRNPTMIPGDIGCECPEGNFLYNNTCYPCPIDCKKCTISECLQCWDPLAQPQNLSCFCPEGTYLYSSFPYTQCKNCHNDCYNCTDSVKCLSCKIIGQSPADIGCKCPDRYQVSDLKCKLCENWNDNLKECRYCSPVQFFDGEEC
ncbi:hypothetical protein SteCoe_23238 [Stentor coeruleus]|uniref:TNFR-Cys domain-containing protein n=1 Tax=Stentor coeruleus TaxID=5963 RepID=A0A1R2BKF2_9CILI|nr:hypothetical protein SteCoe_23238 [Stentor coeruleus]